MSGLEAMCLKFYQDSALGTTLYAFQLQLYIHAVEERQGNSYVYLPSVSEP